jgi:hypothetical protein
MHTFLPQFKIDLWLLAEDLDENDLQVLEEAEKDSSVGKTICCFDEARGAYYSIAEKLSGFARMIIYSEQAGNALDGIVEMQEGHMTKGKLD